MKQIEVAITDDHPMVLAGLSQLLDSCDNIAVQATYTSGGELLEGLKQRRPDVLLLDVLLPDHSGEELARVVSADYPDVRILVITSVDTNFHIRRMLQQGCMGYLLKNADRDMLLDAINAVYAGRQYITASLKEQLLQDVLQTRKGAHAQVMLTRREKEILQLIAREYTSPEIADKLFLSLRTVENHRKHLLAKFDVKNMIGLVRKALDMGLVE